MSEIVPLAIRIRDVYLQTFDKIGGPEVFAAWAASHKSIYYPMLIKLMPVNVLVAPSQEFDEQLTDDQKDRIALEYLRGRGIIDAEKGDDNESGLN